MLRIVALFLMSTACAKAVTLTQTVPGDILFDLTSLAPDNAGEYFDNAYERDLTYLTIDDIPNNIKWRLYAKISHEIPGINIRVKREGNGTGAIVPVGGKRYTDLAPGITYTEIFRGEGKRFDIPMRTQIKGIGVSDDNGTFGTSIEYKIETELPATPEPMEPM